MTTTFNNEGFFSALNAERLSRQMTWKDVAAGAGIQASTLTRMGDGKNPDVNGLAALLRWSGLKAEDFIPEAASEEPHNLTKAVALLRADKNIEKDKMDVLVNILTSTYSVLKG